MTKKEEMEIRKKRKKIIKEDHERQQSFRKMLRERRRKAREAVFPPLKNSGEISKIRCDFCSRMFHPWDVDIQEEIVAKWICDDCKKGGKR